MPPDSKLPKSKGNALSSFVDQFLRDPYAVAAANIRLNGILAI